MQRLVKSSSNLFGDYMRNGFAVIAEFLNKDQVKTLVDESERIIGKYFVSSESKAVVKPEEFNFDNQSVIHRDQVTITIHPNAFDETGHLKIPKYAALNTIGMKLHQNFDAFRQVTFSENVKSVLRWLQYINPIVFESAIVYKAPGCSELPLHQDESYYRTDPPGSGVAFWIALDDATEQNGCLQVYPGSHKMSYLPRVFVEMHNQVKIIEENNAYKDLDESKFVPVPVSKGSLVLIDGFLIHKSGNNATDLLRRAYQFHLYDGNRSHWLGNNIVKEGQVYSFTPIY
ncbi:hypothetical protein B4U79_16176 [Dinothrombium tinctorium]|uniref:Phytanoyl-CoA dioxygenase domain-containing protein 1-like protein n=1 Tax=Dinothrombium tinctorium TaxID=1965070 RepID=A0A3S3QBQ3_9ACAR|nr:hypothetical protein B4U79_16176 [Dinothrombium tinctorium]